jgi:preprotein translocase subunit SecD
MLNKYPLWKYIIIGFVLILGALYALPNLYGEIPAVQVSASKTAPLDNAIVKTITQSLEKEGIPFVDVDQLEKQILVSFSNTENQLKARDIILENLDKNDYIVALNLAPATPAWLKSFGGSPMKLGLDLRGGLHFLMEVDMDAAISKKESQYVSDFKSELRDAKLYYKYVRESASEGIDLGFSDFEKQEKALEILQTKYRELIFTTGENADIYTISAKMTEQTLKEARDYAVQQNMTILRSRVNQTGVAEPLVQRQGRDRIVVELPGVQDSAQVKKILGATATLDFHLVDKKYDAYDAARSGRAPAGTKLSFDRSKQPVLLEKRVILTGDHITDAVSGFDENGRPQVNIVLDGEGGNRMSAFTKNNIGNPMATLFVEYKPETKMVNGKKTNVNKRIEEVINVATIQAQLGSRFRITGLDSPKEAHDLALLLRAGALIAPISIVEERTVGPSLGQDNIDKGILAVTLGLVAVMIFMVIYYRVFGLFANVALAFNLVLIVAVMSMIGATLTLPGIAGIVLTVGMAVDANVLIFERIREELRNGLSVQQAIHEGYNKAFSTIADANVTTLIAAVILFAIGTGAIKGFAVTLSIGIVTSMFTAIMGTRAIVNGLYGGKRLKTLPI